MSSVHKLKQVESEFRENKHERFIVVLYSLGILGHTGQFQSIKPKMQMEKGLKEYVAWNRSSVYNPLMHERIS